MNRSQFPSLLLVAAATMLSSCDSGSDSSSDGTSRPGGIPADTVTFGIPWKSGIAYGTLTDARDGQVYRTVKIGTQTWMAQNLNYRNSGSSSDTVGVCYNNRADSCKKYGRLYAWLELMNGTSSSSASPSGVQGLCPTGWHVPSDAEWDTLMNVVAGSSSAGTRLKSTGGWNVNNGTSGNGSDDYGFRALPGGSVVDGISYVAGDESYWWSATEEDFFSAWRRYMNHKEAAVRRSFNFKTYGFSARCLKD